MNGPDGFIFLALSNVWLCALASKPQASAETHRLHLEFWVFQEQLCEVELEIKAVEQ